MCSFSHSGAQGEEGVGPAWMGVTLQRIANLVGSVTSVQVPIIRLFIVGLRGASRQLRLWILQDGRMGIIDMRWRPATPCSRFVVRTERGALLFVAMW